MKKLLLLTTLSLSLLSASLANAGDYTKESILLPEQIPQSNYFEASLSSVYEESTNLWGARFDLAAAIGSELSLGAFYTASWPGNVDELVGNTDHKYGLSGATALPDLDIFRGRTYLRLDLGANTTNSDTDLFFSSWLGIRYPMDFVLAGLKADLALGYTGYFDTDYRDSLGAKVGLSYAF